MWKADLFVGRAEADRWVGATVKINPRQLEAARGLRLAIVPCRFGGKDSITFNQQKNLVICPMPYDNSFTEIFYQGFQLVKKFLNAGAKRPPEMELSHGPDRIACKELEQKSKYPVLDVLESLNVIKQPTLLDTEISTANIYTEGDVSSVKINTIIAPISLNG